MPKAAIPSEDQEQAAIVKRLQALGLCFTHPPNGGARSKSEGAKFKRLGVVAGVPDLLIFTRAPNLPDARGVAIELKDRNGGDGGSAVQKEFHRRLRAEGWHVEICNGATEAWEFLVSLGFSRCQGCGRHEYAIDVTSLGELFAECPGCSHSP